MRFSILIPAYKRDFFEECLNSVFSIEYDDYEVIVLNDASPQGLDAIVDRFLDNPKLRYYKNDTNVGAIRLVENWNKCLELAKGEYVICMGDDDRMLPCCLKEYDKIIQQYPNLAVYHGWTEIIDANGNFFYFQMPRPLWQSAYSMFIQYRRDQCRQWIGDFCFNTEMLRQAGGFFPMPLAWGSDRITVLRAASYAGIANTQVPVFQFRFSNKSISSSDQYAIMMESRKKMLNWYNDFFSKKADNDIDEKMRRLAIASYPSEMFSDYSNDIANDMKRNGCFRKFFYWWKRRKEFDLTIRSFIKAFLIYFGINISKR